MENILGTIFLLLSIVLPLVLFYNRSRWGKAQKLTGIIAFTFLWLFVGTPLHELSHMAGAWLAGVEITEFRLIPQYWKGDFNTAYIITGDQSRMQSVIIKASPYLKDALFTITAYMILRRKKIRGYLAAGSVFAVGMLYSIFNVCVNFAGYIIGATGDFQGIADKTGPLWTYAFGITLLAVTATLTLRILNLYKGFPDQQKD